MTKFSIIIPCFNAEATLGTTLDSIRAQSYTDWEAIIVDDGSTDKSGQIARSFAQRDSRITSVRNKLKNPSTARNYGAMNIAHGEIFAFCDADDVWSTGKLASLAQAFTDPKIHGAFGQIAFFKNTPRDASVFSTVPNGNLTIEILLGENPVCTCSNLSIRRDSFIRSGGFAIDMVHNEDLDWLVRAVGQGLQIVGLQELHTYYRSSPGGLSSDLEAMATSRQRVFATAAQFGVCPSPQNHAIYHRYLARRALRMCDNRRLPLRFTLAGIKSSPLGFFSSPRRGALTLIAALGVLVMPRPLIRSLFA
ncbi:Glycosyl transferase family 2 [Aliiroseovarius halocynthiae]|uniref:Glycosyltransferase family 2 protein n=1 Tax=Aliiroseovarius halocynthiae TaxID=985055 RepID=A0A545SWP9_9RHOB|nr:glycosyltransferase family 2 protein [Aliiroseovarius halocynthiae]TQV69388.1 glycosyltransferase family 2 protein [Aliiroseovarius halocynthiae]SMR72777.1 Glycosyl transferase family 2 [Aliiroseovarius halocynthiae]